MFVNLVYSVLVWFGTSASLRGLNATEKPVVIENTNVQPVDSLHNLDVHLDGLLDMHVHRTDSASMLFFR